MDSYLYTIRESVHGKWAYIEVWMHESIREMKSCSKHNREQLYM